MLWYQEVSILALAFCLASCIFNVVRLIKLGKPQDYSERRGNTRKAVEYSFTTAMSPAKKESAFLHLPTYTAGILFHLGTFLSLLIFLLFIVNIEINGTIAGIVSGFLFISGLSGAGILVKRMVMKKLLALSNPDDFISNLLVTLFQFATALMLLNLRIVPAYYIVTAILLFYIPVGKLKHTVYFFAARYQLGYFFGWRGIWPPK